jgi:hypothetical protein
MSDLTRLYLLIAESCQFGDVRKLELVLAPIGRMAALGQ